MQLRLRVDQDGQLGFVETHKIYRYGENGSISIKISLDIDGVNSLGKPIVPYVYRGGSFIPLSQIEKEMGIDKYLKAKKPFYSLIYNGSKSYILVLSAKIYINADTGDYDPEKSSFKIYKLNSVQPTSDGGAVGKYSEISNYTDEYKQWFANFAKMFAKCKYDRGAFLRMRF